MQPEFDSWWGGAGGLYEQRLGRERAATMNPLATLAAEGVTVAFGSDAPVTPLAPWAAVRAAIRHHQPGSRMSAGQALTAHTVNGWYAAGRSAEQARRLGTLAPGHPATLTVWDVADVGAAIDRGGAPETLLTVRDGHVLHQVGTSIR